MISLKYYSIVKGLTKGFSTESFFSSAMKFLHTSATNTGSNPMISKEVNSSLLNFQPLIFL